MLIAILNKTSGQHPTKQQLYGHLPPITKTILVRQTRHAGHCWRSSDKLITDVLVWIPVHGRAKVGRPARTCENTGCSPGDLPEAMNDWEGCRVRIGDIRTDGTTRERWWWYLYIYIYIYTHDGHLINKMNCAETGGNRKQYLQFNLFQGNQLW